MGWIADLLSEIPSAAKYKIQLEQLSTENITLKAKFETCEKNLDRANKEIGNLNLVINGLKNKDQNKYETATIKVLKTFFDAGRELPANYIASALSMDINTALYHFDILLKDNLITQTMAGSESSWTGTSDPDMFDLTPEGRKYVIENNLIT